MCSDVELFGLTLVKDVELAAPSLVVVENCGSVGLCGDVKTWRINTMEICVAEGTAIGG